MRISGRTWSQLFLCAVACAAQIRAFQASAHSAAAQVKSAQVLGRVVEAGTNTPVKNAIVAIHTASGDRLEAARTTADGSFKFPRVPSGGWSVEVDKAGYRVLLVRSSEVPETPADNSVILALTKLPRD